MEKSDIDKFKHPDLSTLLIHSNWGKVFGRNILMPSAQSVLIRIMENPQYLFSEKKDDMFTLEERDAIFE